MRTTAAVLLAAAVLAAAPALRAEPAEPPPPAEYVRYLPLDSTGTGTWGADLPPHSADSGVAAVTIEADWWRGPGDARVGDRHKAPMEGFRWEVRRGEGPWVAVPDAARGLGLRARATVASDAEGASNLTTGGPPTGRWEVRQTAGGEYPLRVRLAITTFGDPLLVKNLAVKSWTMPDLDPPKKVGEPRFPDRTDNPTLRMGDAIKVEVTVANIGSRRTKECVVELALGGFRDPAPPRRIAFAELPRLKGGATATLTLEGVVPEEYALESGTHEIRVVVDPDNTQRDIEPLDNVRVRAFRYEAGDPDAATRPMDEDLRDR